MMKHPYPCGAPLVMTTTMEVVWVAVPDRRNSSRDDVATSDGVRTPMRPLS
jgi:hypothetical protein